jgi:hypothetical protein
MFAQAIYEPPPSILLTSPSTFSPLFLVLSGGI